VEADTMDQPALPAPERPERPRGRHEARRSVGGPARAAIAVVAGSVVFGLVLAAWLIGSAKKAPPPSAEAGSTAKDAPTSRPPGPAAFGNLVVNWSFEQDLSGWEVLGAADAAQEPQGRTSGSCASVRARGPEPGRVGLACPRSAPRPSGAGAMWPRPGCARPPPASR
jgi:hypothetical protein